MVTILKNWVLELLKSELLRVKNCSSHPIFSAHSDLAPFRRAMVTRTQGLRLQNMSFLQPAVAFQHCP